MPSKDMKELKEEIIKKNILSTLSTEMVEEESMGSITTAKEAPACTPQHQLPTEPMKQRLAKLDEISQMAKDFKSKFAKLRKDVDDWNMKYRKRVVDMHLDVGSFEKKVKKKITLEKTRVSELQMFAEKNLRRRLWIERRQAKMVFENPEKTLITTLIELGFNVAQNMLWTLAMIRDYFANRRN